MLNGEFRMHATAISRAHVLAGDISPLTQMIADREAEATAGMSGYQTLVFHVDGYVNDDRELFQIPEVRAWFKKLDADVPHFLWFLSPYAQIHGLYAACLSTVEWDGQNQQVVFDPEELQRFLAQRLNSIGLYCWERGIEPDPGAISIGEAYGIVIDPQRFYAPLLEEVEKQGNTMAEAADRSEQMLRDYLRLSEQAGTEAKKLLMQAVGGDPDQAKAVVEALNRLSWSEAEIIAQAIPWFGAAAIPHLAKTAYGKKKSTITCSLRALSWIGGEEALSILCRRFEELPTRGEAIEGLIDIGMPAIPRLISYVGHQQAEIRQLATYALGKLRVRDAKGLLQRVVTGDRSGIVRDMAAVALRWLDGEPCEMNMRGVMPIIDLKPVHR